MAVYLFHEPVAHGGSEVSLRFQPVATNSDELHVLADLHLPQRDQRPYVVTIEQRYEVGSSATRAQSEKWEPWELLISHNYVNEGPGERRLATIDFTSKNKSLSNRGEHPRQLEVRISLFEDSAKTKKVREATARLPVPQP